MITSARNKKLKSNSKRIHITVPYKIYKRIKEIKNGYNKRYSSNISMSQIVRISVKDKLSSTDNNLKSLKNDKEIDILVSDLCTVIGKYYRQNANGYSNLNQLARAINKMNKNAVTPIPPKAIDEIREYINNAKDISNTNQQLKHIRKELKSIWQLLK